MRPPALAQTLLAAVAPTNDYEIIAGDLHEEFITIRYLRGAKAANRWYWSQTLHSIPSLLSYSKSKSSPLRSMSAALISTAVLLTMLVVSIAIGEGFRSLYGSERTPIYLEIGVYYAETIVFGSILARLVRSDGLRVTFFASIFLVWCFVIPALLGNPHSQAPLRDWIVLCGVVPTMCFGAGLYQIVSRRIVGN